MEVADIGAGRQTTVGRRLLSLDVFRGFDMFWLAGGCELAIAVSALLGAAPGAWVADQMRHPAWEGLRFIDMIFPTFIFIAGVSFPFSHARQVEQGCSRAAVTLRILKRYLLLFVFGLAYNGFFRNGPANTVWGSVLGRIAVAWAGAALLYVFFRFRARAVIAALLLLVYWALFLFFVAPDHPDAGRFSMEGCIAGWVDRMFVPGKLTNAGVISSQGLLSNIPAVVNAMFGVFTGELLRRTDLGGGRKTAVMLVAAAASLAAGLLVAFGCGEWSFPCIKKLWSPSYVFFATAYALAVFAVFYWLIDVKGWWRCTLFFKVIGMNAITVYLGRGLGLEDCYRKLFTWFPTLVPASLSPLVAAVTLTAFLWLILYWLYRRQIFLKV
ncbi:MAG: DUF5009 domain-containing protein [Kiritimatiellae bacterium]|nr:DUF5009 domain-containing protein [Kiritimatiellia bacterium]